jgi:hypothetical protein
VHLEYTAKETLEETRLLLHLTHVVVVAELVHLAELLRQQTQVMAELDYFLVFQDQV